MIGLRLCKVLIRPLFELSFAKSILSIVLIVFFGINGHAQNIDREKLLLIKKEFQLRQDSAQNILNNQLKKLPSFGKTDSTKYIKQKIQYFEGNVPIIYRTDNLLSAFVLKSDKVKVGGSLGYNLSGETQSITIWDGGKVDQDHIELQDRVNLEDNPIFSGKNDHATHVAGTIMASGFNRNAEGIANKARLRSYDFDNDIEEIVDEALSGTYLSNHSYGTLTGWETASLGTWIWWGDSSISELEDYRFGFYDSKARYIDGITHANPYYLIVNSAGNHRNDLGPTKTTYHLVPFFDGTLLSYIPSFKSRNRDGNNTGYDSMSGMAVSKNILTVGSSDYGSSISNFSSVGPTDDGRVKPDIIAPGRNVTSTLPNDSYGQKSGTSMAAPGVSGSLALIREFYIQNYSDLPTSSLLKALVIHTADQLDGNLGPSYASGWGLLNTEKAIEVLNTDFNSGKNQLVRNLNLQNNEEISFDVIPNGTEDLKATIVWTDPEGPLLPKRLNDPTSILINDLDIAISDNQNTYYPFKMNPRFPSRRAARGVNNLDNVEQILIEDLDSNQYTVKISHKNTLQNGNQNFSLVITGIITGDIIEPSTPVPIFPINQNVDDTSPEFSWSDSSNSDYYEIQLSTNSSFNELVWSEEGIIENHTSYPNELQSNTTYFWRIRSKNQYLTSDWSSTVSFETSDFSDLFVWNYISSQNANGYVESMVTDLHGNLYVSFVKEGGTTREIYKYDLDNGSWTFLRSGFYRGLIRLSNGEILGWTEWGIESLGLDFDRQNLIFSVDLTNSGGLSIRELVTLNNGLIYKVMTDWGTSNLNDKIYVSTDRGRSWSEVAVLPYKSQSQRLSVYGNEFLITTWGDGTYRSNNTGQSWQKINDYSYGYSITKSSNGSYFLGTLNGLYVSDNINFNWTKPENGAIEFSKVLGVLESDNGLLIANSYACGGIGDGVFVSIDYGNTWTTSNDGLLDITHYSTRSLYKDLNGNILIGSGTGAYADGGAVYISTKSELLNFVSEETGINTPSTVQILTPDGSEFPLDGVQIDWTEDVNASKYVLHLSLTTSFIEEGFTVYESETNTLSLLNLDSENTFFYKVKAVNALGESEWSETHSFSVGNDTDNDGITNDLDKCPNTPAGETVDAEGCSDSQKDTDEDGVTDDKDQCADTTSGVTVDDFGCSSSQTDSDNDGVTNDIDQCPNTPAGETVDTDGCSDSQKDTDGDGIPDDLDQCPNTSSGQAVDQKGCEVFPFDAFTLYTETPACPGVSNGLIELTASSDIQGYVFDVQLTGNGRNETYPDVLSSSSILSITDLAPGTYGVTISLDDGYSIVFDEVVIEEAGDLSAKRQRIDKTSSRVYYTVSGNDSYTVTVNSRSYRYEVDTKADQTIAVPISSGDNTITIKGADCQSIFLDSVTSVGITLYPNPVESGFYLAGGYVGKVVIYDSAGMVVKTVDLRDTEENYIAIGELTPGVYFVHLQDRGGEIIKVVKR